VFSAAFIFEPGQYDAEFTRLDGLIEAAARAMPGFLGVELWVSEDGKRRNATYYWDSLEELKAFSRHPDHLEAQRQYTRWYKGFHIVISEVVRSYGDGALAHLTPNSRARGSV
jgi:heme-degrading monooxygenase HmoA